MWRNAKDDPPQKDGRYAVMYYGQAGSPQYLGVPWVLEYRVLGGWFWDGEPSAFGKPPGGDNDMWYDPADDAQRSAAPCVPFPSTSRPVAYTAGGFPARDVGPFRALLLGS